MRTVRLLLIGSFVAVAACSDATAPSVESSDFHISPALSADEQQAARVVRSYYDARATTEYRNFLETLLAQERSAERREVLQQRLRGLSGTTSILASSDDECDGVDFCEGEEDGAIHIRKAETTAGTEKVQAYLSASRYGTLCNDLTVHVGSDNANVNDCTGWLKNWQLTTEMPLNLKSCPDDQKIAASTTHTADNKVAFSNDDAACIEEHWDETVGMGGGEDDQETDEYEWCLIRHTYINGKLVESEIVYCW